MGLTDDQVQQLTDLSLESEAFCGHLFCGDDEDAGRLKVEGILAMRLRDGVVWLEMREERWEL
jgi:hypothetical protein